MAEAVAMLKGMVAKVKSSFGGDDAAEADGHVHAVGHVLTDMEAKAEELGDDVRAAVSDLIDAFGELDEKIHDKLLFADIKKAVDSHTDVIIFNIDSKANARAGRDAILSVFMKVLN